MYKRQALELDTELLLRVPAVDDANITISDRDNSFILGLDFGISETRLLLNPGSDPEGRFLLGELFKIALEGENDSSSPFRKIELLLSRGVV